MAHGAESPASSDLSEPPSPGSDGEDQLSSAVPSSRPSVDISAADAEHLAPPSKRRKTGPSSLATFDRAPSSQLGEEEDDNISLSSDGYSTGPGSPSHGEYAIRDDAQTECMWRDCTFGNAIHNDELVKHVQNTHCATGGPKRTKYVCEWGECQRKTSNHPSGYALKAHMRSHTKEKPYYCALPECDKSFTRSDALAKHMRTVHEPEHLKAQANDVAVTPGKRGSKNKLTNGSASTRAANAESSALKSTLDGDEAEKPSNNITYIPAHHPVTGQPGFMIHYPPDIEFTQYESSVQANDLMRMLRRQLHWAEQEGKELTKEIEELEAVKREEWITKEILLEGVMETELTHAENEDALADVDDNVKGAMEKDVVPAKQLAWSGKKPVKRRPKKARVEPVVDEPEDTVMDDVDGDDTADDRTPSPPPTGRSGGGFDGDDDPYDNYLAGQMAEFEERQRKVRERIHGSGNTPQKTAEEQKEAEDDAIGALMDMGTYQQNPSAP